MPENYVSDRRFRPMNANEVIPWLQSHRYIWYQAPMDHSPRKVHCTSVLKTWKRDANRFSVGVSVFTDGGELRFRVDESHLDRLRMPFDLWHHGITATLDHVSYVGRTKPAIVLSQSNGYHLEMRDVNHAIHFARRQSMELTVSMWRNGRKLTRTLVPAVPPISGERTFGGSL